MSTPKQACPFKSLPCLLFPDINTVLGKERSPVGSEEVRVPIAREQAVMESSMDTGKGKKDAHHIEIYDIELYLSKLIRYYFVTTDSYE